MPPEIDTNSPAISTAAPAGSEGTGAPAAAVAASATSGAAPATDASQAPDAGAATAAPATPSASEAPAAETAKATEAKPESTPSLLEAAQAKLPGKEGDKPAAPDAKPTDGTKEGTPADGAKPATDAKPDADAKPADKPADGKSDKKDGDSAPAKEALAEKPQARSYEAFKVPEGTKLDNKQVKAFTDVLDAADISPQERGQKLVDMHVAEVTRIVKDVQENQRKVWTDYTNRLKDDYAKDPDLGGNRRDTTLGIAKHMVEQYGGSEEQVGELLAMMTHTGMGNYVGLSRLLNNLFHAFVENQIAPGNPPSRGSGRRSFQDVAYGDGPANGAAT